MAGILDFQQFIGGADQIKCESVFPSNQRTLLYTFSVDITGWTFSADYQTLVVDAVTFNRNTGQPNFASSKVIGYFDKVDITGGNVPVIVSAVAGTLKVHMPANMYSGPIIPDARQNVPITIFALTWTDDSSPTQINTHRWALIQNYEPDVEIGDPTLHADYNALVVAT